MKVSYFSGMNSNRTAIQKLVESLKGIPYDTKFSYKELSVLAGTDVLKNRSTLTATQRHLLRHHDRTLINIRGYGYQVCHPEKENEWLLKELQIEDHRKYLISEVTPMDGAILISYRELTESPEDVQIGRMSTMDSAVVSYLKSRG